MKRIVVRRIVFKFILGIAWIVFALLSSCNDSDSPIITIPREYKGILLIKEWKAVGPFMFDTLHQNSLNTFQNKDLKDFGIEEENFCEDDFNKFHSKHTPFVIDCSNSPVKLFDYIDKKSKNNKSNFYLFTKIYSESDQDVVFIFDGSRNYKVWINREPVLEVLNKDNAGKNGDRFLRFRLHKGMNTVFAKVNRGTNKYSWGIFMAIASESVANQIFKWNYLSDFINDSFVSDSLSLYLGPHLKAELKIVDKNGKLILNENCISNNENNCNVNCNQLPNGIHNAILLAGNDSLNQLFFKGDIFKFINELYLETRKLSCQKNVMEDVSLAIDRLDFLTEKLDESSEAGIRYYHRNILYYANNLHELIGYIKKAKNDSLFPGTILKSYHSGNDTTLHQFMFYPNKESINKKPMPLIIFVPYVINEESMSRSWYIGNLDQIEADKKMSDLYGFSLAWLFIKGQDFNPIEAMNEVRHILMSIKRDYYIDSTKVYLMGECVGGQRALLIAKENPDSFSGVAVRAPITTDFEDHINPMNFVSNFQNLHVFVVHGKNDTEVPIRNTKKFIKKAEKDQIKIDFLESEHGHLHISRDERFILFSYLDSIQQFSNEDYPGIVKYITYDTVPISVYWIKINEINLGCRAQIFAKYDTIKNTYTVQTENIISYSIRFREQDFQFNNNISIYTNNKLNYTGKPIRSELSISVVK